LGGNATFSGTTYQANVIAYVAVHVLTETKLHWLPLADDTPTALAGEVKGPGDDARIQFAPPSASIEVQSKHGLKGPKTTEKALATIRDASQWDDSTTVILAVDSSSSESVRIDLRKDLDRLRSGRTDDLRDITKTIITALGAEIIQTLKRIRVVVVDVDSVGDSGLTRALELLSDNLEDPSQAAAAFALLQADAASMCAKKEARSKQELVQLLANAGIRLRPPRKTRKWHEDLRYSRNLLKNEEPQAALAMLSQVEADLRSGTPDGEVLYRLNQHKAAAHLQLHHLDLAIQFAQRALDHDPSGLYALSNLATAYALAGDVDDARIFAEKLIAAHPESTEAWATAVQVAAIIGDTAPKVPENISAASAYQCELARICLVRGDFDDARRITSSLIAAGDRSAPTLLLRVETLLANDVDQLPAAERLARATDVVRISTEILESHSPITDAIRRKALVTRSIAQRALGKVDESHADVERAREISPDEPSVIAAAAQARIQGGDEEGALALLSAPIVATTPFLLTLRASLLASRDPVAARRDLDGVIKILADKEQDLPDSVRSGAAEAALSLGDSALARKLLSETSATFKTSGHYLLMQGRVSASEGDLQAAEQFYREAIAQIPTHKADLLAEFATLLLRAGFADRAVTVFKEVTVPDSALRQFVHALIQTDHLGDAQLAIERSGKGGMLPDWAVAYAAKIATRRNDPEAAAQYLEDLVARGQATPAGRLMLVETLLDLNQTPRAHAHTEALRRDEELEPRERMQLAHLQVKIGRPEEGVATALKAFREAPHNPEINRAFVGAVFLSKLPPLEVTEVGPNTHVQLRGEGGTILEYLVLPRMSGDGSLLPHEISDDAAKQTGLLGLRVGDQFIQNKDTWFEKRWTVEQLQSSTKYLFNYVLSNYHTRFPTEEFFVAGFKLDPEHPSLKDFLPVIASTESRAKHIEHLLGLYREQILPLEFVANLAGGSVSGLMGHISFTADGGPLFVEWSGEEGQRLSRDTAKSATTIVLTESALVTLQRLDLLDTVRTRYQCIAPRSLRDLIRKELSEAEERVTEGHSVVVPGGPTGFAMQSFEAGDAVLVNARDRHKALLDWLDREVTILPRPLAAFGENIKQTEEFRTQLGHASSDAVELAKHNVATLLADDLGLRIVARHSNTPSVSTLSVVHVLTEEGVIAEEARDRFLIDLVEQHYNAVAPTAELLLESMAPTREANARRQAFALLAGPEMTIVESARTLVRAIKIAATRVGTITTDQIASEGLAAMALRFPAKASAQVVARVAEAELFLMPKTLQATKRVCLEFFRRR
jgi:tetratricopeptide (TPR) repeat protein